MVGFDLREVVFGFEVAGWEGHQRQRHAGRARLLPARFYILLPTHFLTHLTIIIQSGTLFLYQFYSAGHAGQKNSRATHNQRGYGKAEWRQSGYGKAEWRQSGYEKAEWSQLQVNGFAAEPMPLPRSLCFILVIMHQLWLCLSSY